MKKTILSLLLLVVATAVLISCGDDPEPGGGGENNTTDVAVTGNVEEIGFNYAQIGGVVNLNMISASYTSVEIGVEISTAQDFANKERSSATGVVGRAFSVTFSSLRSETKYYYRTYVSVSTLSYDYYGTTQSFTTKKIDLGTGAYVDLGLPSGTLWATCNVGASKPEEYGDYFAWGETSTKSDYSWGTYQWRNGSWTTLTKYCQDSSYGYNGFTDTLTELEPEDDAAYVNWGSEWRMPSLAQIQELFNSSYTTTTWTTVNSVYGRLITSKTNGNSIFLPAAGHRSGTSLDYGSCGFYWSRTLYTSDPDNAYGLSFGSDGVYWYGYYRYRGLSVRPVRTSQ